MPFLVLKMRFELVSFGLIIIANTSNKVLVAQQQQGLKIPKKQHPLKNKPNNKGPKLKPSQSTTALHGDKATEFKGTKTGRHCNFCD